MVRAGLQVGRDLDGALVNTGWAVFVVGGVALQGSVWRICARLMKPAVSQRFWGRVTGLHGEEGGFICGCWLCACMLHWLH